jgi:hypothetical protein
MFSLSISPSRKAVQGPLRERDDFASCRLRGGKQATTRFRIPTAVLDGWFGHRRVEGRLDLNRRDQLRVRLSNRTGRDIRRALTNAGDRGSRTWITGQRALRLPPRLETYPRSDRFYIGLN